MTEDERKEAIEDLVHHIERPDYIEKWTRRMEQRKLDARRDKLTSWLKELHEAYDTPVEAGSIKGFCRLVYDYMENDDAEFIYVKAAEALKEIMEGKNE